MQGEYTTELRSLGESEAGDKFVMPAGVYRP